MERSAFQEGIALLQDARPELRFRPGTIDLFWEILAPVPNSTGMEALKAIALDESKKANAPSLIAVLKGIQGPPKEDLEDRAWAEKEWARAWIREWRSPENRERRIKQPAVFRENMRAVCLAVFRHRMIDLAKAAAQIVRDFNLAEVRPMPPVVPPDEDGVQRLRFVDALDPKLRREGVLPSMQWILTQAGDEDGVERPIFG